MIELIPAVDIIDGKCVRLTRGDYETRKVYNEDPLEAAKVFEDCGLRRLHVVDLDGARAGRVINHRVLERLAVHTSLVIDFGGGLNGEDDPLIAFESGARMITGGSIAVRKPEIFAHWIDTYGSDRIILGADARDGRIAVSGWAETTGSELIPFISAYCDRGITKVISTDIGRDGTLGGPSVDMYKDITAAVPRVYLIASGGVSSVADIECLEEAGVPAVIFGKAFYEGRIKKSDLIRMTI
ncbi:MAG: 1-(5-phosphoribosyl)-5-[(5-phosphoribosylamino)methylideneamino] imidazole-4-carboxamide isomerase [Tannerellaceae bacterium]|jgi:phosphoribosylformimino-5-aminoimidazole carboxamide ribotide isomerase|nr:1-(5-phosphoribosyl)-5-[(5-phosphoribosylamino)methylideneamino] imidazole-4-carboxamide isomerase [Tannerellaceae bacterium]